jgi:hypothetical protein
MPRMGPTTTSSRPSLPAIVLGLVPFAGMCFSVAIWDRVDPRIAGLPFNLAWLIGWIVLTSTCMAFAYRIEMARVRRGSPR